MKRILAGVAVLVGIIIFAWVNETNRDTAVGKIENSNTKEHNELGNIMLDTFKRNRGLGAGEHANQTQMLIQIISDLEVIKQHLIKNGTS